LRPEPFGALAYHFGTRRLTFLKDPTLTQIVRSLQSHQDVSAALDAAGVPEERRPTYRAALRRLAEADVICRTESAAQGASQPATETIGAHA
jgi:putative mycofactocin binding protein MftB